MLVAEAFFVATNVMAILGASAVVLLVGYGREGWRLLLIGFVSYGLIAHFVILLLGLTGHLNPGAALFATSATTVVLVGFAYMYGAKLAISGRMDQQMIREEGQNILPVAAMLLCGALAVQLFESGFRASHLKWDDLSYHATVIAQWIVDGEFSIVPSTYQAYYPFAAELLSLWFVLPLKDDSYASLAGLYWLLLAASSVYALVRGGKSSATTAMLITAVFLASPILTTQLARSFSANDLAGAASMVAAIAMIQPGDLTGRFGRRVELVMSGLMAGLAVGCKVTYAIPVTILLFWIVAVRARVAPGFGLISVFLWFSVMALLSGGYWYLRNFILTGNPLFPAEIGPLWGPFDSGSQAKTTAWYWLIREGLPIRELKGLLYWPLTTGLIAVAGYAVIMLKAVQCILKRHSNSISSVDVLLFLIGALAVATFPIMPFSGTYNRPYSEVELSVRYMVLAIIFGIVLYRHILDLQGEYWRHASVAVLIAAYVTSMGGLLRVNDHLLLVGFLLSVFATWGYHYWEKHWYLYVPVVGTVLFVTFAALHLGKFDATTKELYLTGGVASPVGKAWKYLENLPDGSRIAFFMSEPTEYTQNYPLFGRKLQLRPVYVDGYGIQREPMHELSEEVSPAWWGEWEKQSTGWARSRPNISSRQFMGNLINSKVDFVLSSKWSLGQWPPQQILLQESVQAEKIYNDGYSTIWRIQRNADTL